MSGSSASPAGSSLQEASSLGQRQGSRGPNTTGEAGQQQQRAPNGQQASISNNSSNYDQQTGFSTFSSLLSSLGNLQHARLNVQDAGGQSLSVPRIQLRITSGSNASSTSGSASSSLTGAEEGTSLLSVGSGRAGAAQPPSLSRALLRHLSRSTTAGAGSGSSGASGGSGNDSSGTASATTETNVAAAAERHRLNNATVVDLQATARWLESSLGFLALLLAVFLYQHAAGIFSFVWLTWVLCKANDTLRKQVALKDQRRVSYLLATAVVVGLHLPAALWLTSSWQLWRQFGFMPPLTMGTVWDAFYAVAVVDTLIRYGAMVVKVGVLLVCNPIRGEALRRRGQVLTCIEHFVLLYRVAAPAPVWFKFYDTRQMPSLLFSVCTGCYVLAKLTSLVERLGAAMQSCKAVMHPEGQYGQYATPEEVVEGGNQCAICQDPMTKPIRLSCSHLFCEACIAEWFERSRNCPMCRAEVKPASLPSFGDCSTSLLPQLF